MATFATLYGSDLDTELGSNDSAVLFTSARRKHAINQGYRQFADLTECLVRRTTVTMVSTTQEYSLLSSLTDFLRVADEGPVFRKYDTAGTITLTQAGDEDFPQREVQWLDAAQAGWRSTEVGTPTGWYLRRDGGRLWFGLDHYPDISTSETAELILPYVPLPSTMTSDTEVPFTYSGPVRWDLQPYHQALVHYAAHDLEKLRKDPAASDRQLQKFLGYVQRYLQSVHTKGPRSVRVSRRYFAEARGRGRDPDVTTPWWSRT